MQRFMYYSMYAVVEVQNLVNSKFPPFNSKIHHRELAELTHSLTKFLANHFRYPQKDLRKVNWPADLWSMVERKFFKSHLSINGKQRYDWKIIMCEETKR